MKSDLTKLSLESRASLTDYLRTMTKVNDKSSAELLGQRLVLLAELSPFDFVDLLAADLTRWVRAHIIIEICSNIMVGENATARKRLVRKLRTLLYANGEINHKQSKVLLTICVQLFIALYPRFQTINDLQTKLQQDTKAGALKAALVAEIDRYFFADSDNGIPHDGAQTKVEEAVRLITELTNLLIGFKNAPSLDVFNKLVRILNGMVKGSEVFLYELDESEVLECMAGTSRIQKPRIYVKDNKMLEECLELGNLLLNNKGGEDNDFLSVVPIVTVRELKPKSIGAFIIHTPVEIDFADLSFLSVLLPSISKVAIDLISLDRERKLTDLNVALDYLQHQFRKPASTISDRLTQIKPAVAKTSNDELKSLFNIVNLLNNYSLFIVDKIGQTVALERRTYTPELEDVDLAALVREAFELLSSYNSPRLGKWTRGQWKKMRLIDPLPSRAKADTYLLKLAIGEYIENAVEFSRSQVIVAITEEKSSFCIEVKDDGKRRPEKEPLYFREQFSTRRGGTGKGLLFVKNVADTHGGKYGYEYHEGHETPKVFYIKLPKNTTESSR